jgi:hypothetical protein
MRSTVGRPGAALQPGGEHLGQQLDAAVRGDAPRPAGRAPAVRAAQQQRAGLAAAEGLGDALHGGVVRRQRLGQGWGRLLATLAPGHIGRQDQGGHLAGQATRGGEGVHRVGGRARRCFARCARSRARRCGPRSRCPTAAGRRRARVERGVVADDVDHRHLALAGVVQVGQAIAQAAAQVQQGRGGLVGHARIAVGRAGGHAFEQGQHRAHARLVVQRGDEVHLAGAGVGEADLDAGIGQGLHQGLCALGHGCLRQGDVQAGY